MNENKGRKVEEKATRWKNKKEKAERKNIRPREDRGSGSVRVSPGAGCRLTGLSTPATLTERDHLWGRPQTCGELFAECLFLPALQPPAGRDWLSSPRESKHLNESLLPREHHRGP